MQGEEVTGLLAVLGPLTPLVYALLLGTINSEIVDWIKRPIMVKFPELDLWFFVYIGAATGFVIGWFGQVNLFVGVIPEETLGRILSALLVGGGSTLIYKIFKK